MGHSLEEHNKTYHSSISHASKIRNAENAIAKIEDKRSKEQIQADEIEKLKAENAYLREQVERLQLELRLVREIT
jgi:cell division protein FtsB